jgi:hypothetical protein
VGMVLWGIERFLDEHLWLGEDGHLGSLLVQGAGIALAVVGGVLLLTRVGPLQRWRRGEGGDPAPVPVSSSGTPDGGSEDDGDPDGSDSPDPAEATDGSDGSDGAPRSPTRGPMPAVVPSVPSAGTSSPPGAADDVD